MSCPANPPATYDEAVRMLDYLIPYHRAHSEDEVEPVELGGGFHRHA